MVEGDGNSDVHDVDIEQVHTLNTAATP
jgi:hypothetical protein